MSGGRSTWDLDEFHGGLDLRDGLFTDNQTRFREFTNVMVTKGKKIRRRPPCVQDAGAFDANTQGLINISGQLYTFAKKGDTITHTGAVATLVKNLYFDPPDLTSTWTLLNAVLFDGYAVAWIRHTFPSSTYPSMVFMHVWDGLIFAPTFVQDPSLPGSFSPSINDLSQQQYDPAFSPVLSVGVTKIWTNTLRGNSAGSATADGRVWNQRTYTSFLDDGEYWCFVVPEGWGLVHSYVVPRNADWMAIDGRWSYYVLEYNNGTSWVPMREVSVTPSESFTWQPVSVPSRFTGGWNEIQIKVCWGQSAAGLIRLRMVAGATSLTVKTTSISVSAIVGVGGLYHLSIPAIQWTYRGGDLQTTAAHNTGDLPAGRTYLLGVTSDGIGFPELIDITSSFPNGYVREHYHFIKTITTQLTTNGVTQYNAPWASNTTLTGTVTVASGGNTATGVGTLFTSQLQTNEWVTVSGALRQVTGIISDTSLTISGTWGVSAGPSAPITRSDSYATFVSGDTHVYVNAGLLATLAVGNQVSILSTLYTVAAISGQDITLHNLDGTSGNFVSAINRLNLVILTNLPTVVDYIYANNVTSNNAWYTNRLTEYIDLCGNPPTGPDTIQISTASQDNTGGGVTAIAIIRQRMIVCYQASIQLWSVDQATSKTAYLDQLSFGTGNQNNPSPAQWYGTAVLPMVTGFRSIDATGVNLNNLQDLNIGEPISDLPMMQVLSASFWPWFGQLIIAGISGGNLTFLCLDYSRESEITAWSQWTVAGLSTVDAGTMIPDQGKLRFRSGTKLMHFDAQADGAAIPFRDFADVPGNAYESVAFLHFNDMGKPGTNKRFTGMDIVQDGTSSITFALPPYGADFAGLNPGAYLTGPKIQGITYGRSRLPAPMTATAVAPRISSRDETGWRLQRLALDFILLRR